MKKRKRLLSLLLVAAMVVMLIPAGLALPVSAATGNVTDIVKNSACPGSAKVTLSPYTTTNGVWNYNDRTTMTFQYMGSALKGTTQILTPIADSKRTTSTTLQAYLTSQQEYFHFNVDQPCAVYVLATNNLNYVSSGSSNNFTDWTVLSNGSGPTIPSGSALDYEPPETPYYVKRIQWTDKMYCSKVVNSVSVPDIDIQKASLAEGGHTAGSTDFKYAYKKSYAANSTVSIPVIGNYTTQENLLVFVNWNDVEADNATLKSFTYTVQGENPATVTGFTPTDEGGTYNVDLPVDTQSVTVNPTTTNFTATKTANPADGVVDVSTGSGTYTLTVNSGALSKIYTVNFTVSPYSFNTKLSNFNYTPNNGSATAVTGFTASDIGGSYTVTVPEGARSVTLDAALADNRSTLTYDKTYVDDLPNTATVTVTSQAGTQSTYKVNFKLPGYFINDNFNLHGNVGELVSKTLGELSSASNKAINGELIEWVEVVQDPTNANNLAASFRSDFDSQNWPSLKKNFTIDKTVVLTGAFMLEKGSGITHYIDFRKKDGGSSESAGSVVKFNTGGVIYALGSDTTNKLSYKWVSGKWVRFTVIISPDPTAGSMSACPTKVVLNGGIIDQNGNPAVAEVTGTYDLTKTAYLTNSNQMQIVYNSSVSAGTDNRLYEDNIKGYYPAAGTISIPNSANASASGPIEVDLDKYEFNPATMVPENLVLTTGSENTPVPVSWIDFDAKGPDKFILNFNNSLAANTTYNLSLNGVKDFAGNDILGTASFTTGTIDPMTGISISANGSFTQSYGATKSVTFTANTTPLNADINDIIWYVNGNQVGSGKRYVLTPSEVGDYVVSLSVNGTQLSADPVTVTVGKGTRTAPTPEITKDATSISVTPIAEAEYGILPKGSTDAVVYGSSNEFTGLTPGTQYTVYVRMTETDHYIVSDPRTTDITTDAAAFGDVNADGIMNISDVIMAAEIAVGYSSYKADQISRANVSSSSDTVVDIADVIMILERVKGNNAPFPVEVPIE